MKITVLAVIVTLLASLAAAMATPIASLPKAKSTKAGTNCQTTCYMLGSHQYCNTYCY